MKYIITGTNITGDMNLIDPETGTNWIADFIGNHSQEETVTNEDNEIVFTTVQDRDWWKDVVEAHDCLYQYQHVLNGIYGSDAINKVLSKVPCLDLDDYPWVALEALNTFEAAQGNKAV